MSIAEKYAVNELDLAGAPAQAVPARGGKAVLGYVCSALISPWFWVYALVTLCTVLLIAPVKVAIGGYYWDTYLYPDAAWRIASGQIAHVDFFAPAGALEYYSYALLSALFPRGNQLLMAQWALLIVSLPLLIAIFPELRTARRHLGLAVVLPFIFFSFIPLNTKEAYPLAGADGFGIYNRHICLLLYLMVATFVFTRRSRKLEVLTGLLLTALFFTKVTGFLTGAIIVGYAVLAGRLAFAGLARSLALMLTICLVLELPTGMVSAYLRDLGILVSMNSAGFIERFRSPIVMYLDIIAPLSLLAMLLVWTERQHLGFLLSQRAGMRPASRVAAILDHDAFWIVMLVVAAIMFETQNTGSIAFIFVWPWLAHLFSRWHPRHRDRRTAVLLLIALATLPMLMPMVHRTVRVTMASIFYDELKEPALGPYGDIEAKPELLERAYAMRTHYGAVDDHYRKLSRAGHQSSYLLYSEIDYQLSYLIGVSEAVTALKAWEATNKRRLDRIITLDFIDIFTPLLKREPVRLISIGMAADRTVPPLDQRRMAAAGTAQAILVPLCPVTPVRLSLKATFKPLLEGASRVSLTPCWSLYLRP